jgi:hypothetical protein
MPAATPPRRSCAGTCSPGSSSSPTPTRASGRKPPAGSLGSPTTWAPTATWPGGRSHLDPRWQIRLTAVLTILLPVVAGVRHVRAPVRAHLRCRVHRLSPGRARVWGPNRIQGEARRRATQDAASPSPIPGQRRHAQVRALGLGLRRGLGRGRTFARIRARTRALARTRVALVGGLAYVPVGGLTESTLVTQSSSVTPLSTYLPERRFALISSLLFGLLGGLPGLMTGLQIEVEAKSLDPEAARIGVGGSFSCGRSGSRSGSFSGDACPSTPRLLDDAADGEWTWLPAVCPFPAAAHCASQTMFGRSLRRRSAQGAEAGSLMAQTLGPMGAGLGCGDRAPLGRGAGCRRSSARAAGR